MQLRTKLTAGVAAVALIAAPAAARTSAGPVTLATDPAGDWSAASQGLSQLGAAVGQDLTSAAVDREGTNLSFIIGFDQPDVPSGVRRGTLYEWHFTVDGNEGGFVLYGPCNPDPFDIALYGCSPADVATAEPGFLLFGGSSTEVLSARFDDAAGTVTVDVPLTLIGARTGSVISDNTSDSFEATLASTPDENGAMYGTGKAVFVGDDMLITTAYRVPRK